MKYFLFRKLPPAEIETDGFYMIFGGKRTLPGDEWKFEDEKGKTISERIAFVGANSEWQQDETR